MKSRTLWICSLVVLGSLATWSPAPAQWETIQTGFEYRKFTLPGPVEAFVTRMALDDVTARAADSCIASNQFYKEGLPYDGRKPPSQMAVASDDIINYYQQQWGSRNDVICCINGDYWERETYPSGPYTGRPQGGQVLGGWFCRRFGEWGGGSGFYYTVWGVPHLGGDVVNGGGAARQIVTFNDASTANLSGVNVERGADDLILYTPQWGPYTYTSTAGVEVVIEANRPALPIPASVSTNSITGTIVEVRDGASGAIIPFDHVVVSGTGSFAATLRNKCVAGETISIKMAMRDYGFDSRTPTHPAQDWTKAYGSCGVDREIVTGGQKTSNIPSPDLPRDPRTAIAFNASYVYYIVVDGRSSYSIGMNMDDLAAFCIDQLSATCAASLDGGGSSAMWIKGRGIVNRPSDGSERYTTNGMILCAIKPKEQSSRFAANQRVRAVGAAQVRTGPGTNYPVIATLAAASDSVAQSHSLQGVRATAANWWKVKQDATVGWVSESSLTEAPLTSGPGWALYP